MAAWYYRQIYIQKQVNTMRRKAKGEQHGHQHFVTSQLIATHLRHANQFLEPLHLPPLKLLKGVKKTGRAYQRYSSTSIIKSILAATSHLHKLAQARIHLKTVKSLVTIEKTKLATTPTHHDQLLTLNHQKKLIAQQLQHITNQITQINDHLGRITRELTRSSSIAYSRAPTEAFTSLQWHSIRASLPRLNGQVSNACMGLLIRKSDETRIAANLVKLHAQASSILQQLTVMQLECEEHIKPTTTTAAHQYRSAGCDNIIDISALTTRTPTTADRITTTSASHPITGHSPTSLFATKVTSVMMPMITALNWLELNEQLTSPEAVTIITNSIMNHINLHYKYDFSPMPHYLSTALEMLNSYAAKPALAEIILKQLLNLSDESIDATESQHYLLTIQLLFQVYSRDCAQYETIDYKDDGKDRQHASWLFKLCEKTHSLAADSSRKIDVRFIAFNLHQLANHKQSCQAARKQHDHTAGELFTIETPLHAYIHQGREQIRKNTILSKIISVSKACDATSLAAISHFNLQLNRALKQTYTAPLWHTVIAKLQQPNRTLMLPTLPAITKPILNLYALPDTLLGDATATISATAVNEHLIKPLKAAVDYKSRSFTFDLESLAALLGVDPNKFSANIQVILDQLTDFINEHKDSSSTTELLIRSVYRTLVLMSTKTTWYKTDYATSVVLLKCLVVITQEVKRLDVTQRHLTQYSLIEVLQQQLKRLTHYFNSNTLAFDQWLENSYFSLVAFNQGRQSAAVHRKMTQLFLTATDIIDTLDQHPPASLTPLVKLQALKQSYDSKIREHGRMFMVAELSDWRTSLATIIGTAIKKPFFITLIEADLTIIRHLLTPVAKTDSSATYHYRC